jgi:pimeloyl-ACP methyl ester carboxylesterase
MMIQTALLVATTLWAPGAHAANAGLTNLAVPSLTMCRAALSRLEETPPLYATSGPGQVAFLGLDGAVRTAWCGASARPTAAVLEITDAETAAAVPCTPGCAHYVFAWQQDAPAPDCTLPSVTDHPLTRAIADACRLTEVLAGTNGLQGTRIGLVGEGYGAAVALAVAALCPERVAFVVAHQPLGISRCWVADATAPADWRLLDPETFAASVTAPTLLTVGTADEWATPESVQAVQAGLRGPTALWVLDGVGHCAMADVPGWENAWQAWAFRGLAPGP